MVQKQKQWLYEDVDSVELRLEVDDPSDTCLSLIGKNSNKFSEPYTWSLKVYESGEDRYPLDERDIIGELLGEDEDYPTLRDARTIQTEKDNETIFAEEVPIRSSDGNREIPVSDPHSTYKEIARDEARDMAIELRDKYDIEVEIDSHSFYTPEFNF